MIKEHEGTNYELYGRFMDYMLQVPRIGALMISQSKDKILLLETKGGLRRWYGFAKGKLEWGESYQDCAVWEVKEETDYNITIKDPNDFIKVTSEMGVNSQLYVITDVPEGYQFKANTKNEIEGHKWF